MPEPTIYDSQGVPLSDDEPGRADERIKDFFFDGVRLAISQSAGGYEVICFFRARDSEASRAEQYYAVLQVNSLSNLDLQGIVERHVEERYGKTVVTNSEDATVFEIFGDKPGPTPGDSSARGDVKEVVEQGTRATLGVRSYREAYALFWDLLRDVKTRDVAIADNATSSRLSDYTIVIETGDYTGIELLGETDDAVEAMKERRRRERERMMGNDPYGDSNSGIPTRILLSVAGVGLLSLLLVGSYGACVVGGMSTPLIGDPPGVTCGPADGESPIEIESAEWAGNELQISGSLNGTNQSALNTTTLQTNLSVFENETRQNMTQLNITLDDDRFSESVTYTNQSWSPNRTTRAEIRWNGTTATWNWNRSAPSADETSVNGTTTTDQNETSTGSASSTVTPTESENRTATS